MTSNMAEMFNSLLRGCRGLPVTAIASFTFYKLNAWFVSRKKHARSLWTAGKAWPLLASQELAFSKKSLNDRRVHVSIRSTMDMRF